MIGAKGNARVTAIHMALQSGETLVSFMEGIEVCIPEKSGSGVAHFPRHSGSVHDRTTGAASQATRQEVLYA